MIRSNQTEPIKLQHLIGLSLLFGVVLLCIRIQAFQQIHTHYLGGSSRDAGIYVWLFRQHLRSFELMLNSPASFSIASLFETNGFYPYRGTLAWSDNFLLPAGVGFLLAKLGVSETASYNSVILIAQYLNGFVTALLSLTLWRSLSGAAVSGIIFMTAPYLTGHLGHPQLQFAFWIPLGLLFLFQSFRSRSAIYGIGTGLCVAGAFLTTVYYSIFLVVALIIVSTSLIRSMKPPVWAIFGATLGALVLIPFILPYLDAQETFGKREVYEFYYFSASLASLFAAPPTIFLPLYQATSSWARSEAQLFPGVLALTLAVYAVFVTTRKSSKILAILLWLGLPLLKLSPGIGSWLLLAILCALHFKNSSEEAKYQLAIVTLFFVSFLLSLGPLYHPRDRDVIFTPFTLFYSYFPGFSALRAIGRIGVVSLLSISLLAGYVIACHFSRMREWVVVLLVLIVGENWISRYPLEELPPPPSLMSEQLLRSGPGIVLPYSAELTRSGEIKSWGDFAHLQTNYVNWALDRNLTLVNGYSGQRTKLMDELARELTGFPDKRSVSILRSILGVRWVLYVGPLPPHEDQVGLRPIKIDEGGASLFELTDEPLALVSRRLFYLPRTCHELHGTLRSETPTQIHVSLDLGEKVMLKEYVLGDSKTSGFSLSLPPLKDAIRPYRVLFEVGASSSSGVFVESMVAECE